MLRDLEAMLCRHRVLDRFEFSRKKLNDAAAFRADHVIVMLMLIVMFVVGATIAKANFTGQAGFSQKLQGPIDSRLPNARVIFLDQSVKVFAGKMRFRAQKDVENQIALGRAFEPSLLDVFE